MPGATPRNAYRPSRSEVSMRVVPLRTMRDDSSGVPVVWSVIRPLMVPLCASARVAAVRAASAARIGTSRLVSR